MEQIRAYEAEFPEDEIPSRRDARQSEPRWNIIEMGQQSGRAK